MNKLKLILIVLIVLMLSACCHTPNPDYDSIGANCEDEVNINIQLNTTVTPSIPMLVNSKQNSVCVKSQGNVVWTRIGENANQGFTIKFKGQEKKISSKQKKATFNAPNTNSINGHAYGIIMPDADVELDPIIIIIPTRSIR